MAREFGYYLCNNRLIILTRPQPCNARNGARAASAAAIINEVIPAVAPAARMMVVDWVFTQDVIITYQELLPVLKAWTALPGAEWSHVGVGDPRIQELLQADGLWPEEH